MKRSGDTDLYLGNNVHIPHRCAYEFDMAVEDVRQGKIMRQVDGKAVAVGPTYGETLRITINATGWRRPSALRFGAPVTLHIYGAETAYIPAGYRQVVLDRDPVPGSVRVVLSQGDSKETPQTFSVVGRVVTIPDDAEAELTVFYDPIVEGLIASYSRGSKYGPGDGNFTLVIEEVEPLS